MHSLAIFLGFVWLAYSLNVSLHAIASSIAGICK